MDFLKKLFAGVQGNDEALTKALEAGATIVDVRTPGEYAQGHISGSINIPLQDMDRQEKKFRSMKQPVVTCCASGRRSGMAADRLKSWNVEAYNGGGWQQLSRTLNQS